MSSAVFLSLFTARLRKIASVLVTLIFCGIFLPVCLHWIQHKDGWSSTYLLIYDNTGATAVHLASSVVGMIGSASLGRRILRVSEVNRCSVALASPSSTFLGYFLILVGLMGNLLQSLNIGIYPIDVFDAVLVTNSMMAISGSIITFTLIHCCFNSNHFGYWDTVRCLQSAVSALIAISFGVEYYLPSSAFIIGALTCALFSVVSTIIDSSCIEDSCNIIGTHFTGAMIGAVLLPLLCKWEALGENATVGTRFSKCAKQAIYSLFIIFCCAAIFVPIFLLLKITHLFRNEAEANNHSRTRHLEENRGIHWYSRFFRKRSSIFLTKPAFDDPSAFVILETRGKERRRPWIPKRNESRHVSFLMHD